MAVTQTSLFAWHQVRPVLPERQQQVFEVIEQYPKCDNLFISQKTGLPINSVTGRVKELRDKGLVKEAGQSKNAMTGRPTIRWEAL